MPVIPSVGRNIGGNVPTAASEVAHENTPPHGPAGERGNAAHQYMLLVAMHDVRIAQLRQYGRGERIKLLLAYMPGVSNYMHLQIADRFTALPASETDKAGGRFL